jgi:methyl-accepting chemotaxis protein
MDALVNEIATASNEQASGITQLTTAVQQMDKVTQANASSAEETASAAEQLHAHSDVLKESVVELNLLVHGADKNAPHAASFAAPAPVHKSVSAPRRSTPPPAPNTTIGGSKSSGGRFLPMG